MTKVHFGISVPQIRRTWEEAKAAAIEFESLGYDSIWVNDHLYGPQAPSMAILEAWSMVAALAAVTSRVEIGTLVTPAGMRNPAHLGKVIATVDNIAGGRIIPGLGGGWMAREFTDFNVPFLSTSQRLVQLRETVRLLRKMWDPAQQGVTFDGKYVKADNVFCEPKPPRRPPLLIGGSGEQVTMKIAARYADIWNNLAGHQARLEHKVQVLRDHCAAVGRDPSEVVVSQQCLVTLAPSDAEAEPMAQRSKQLFGGHMGDPTGPLALTGTAATVRSQIQKHVDLGCTMFVMEFFGRDTREPARLFSETVMPHFQ